jgi:hydrophobic/amphiphilic exporter-1 (mainly G- bacteria), HAE1 family
MTDRTQTIRASVDDVQATMAVTIVLVVIVIFLFLQDAWATVIVCVAVPMSLVGAGAVMYFFGYSLDNLSLMGLTIAVGFVVDDAIVMLENIFRHVESGMSPVPLRSQHHCAHRNYFADRDRQEERHHDDRLRARCRAQ